YGDMELATAVHFKIFRERKIHLEPHVDLELFLQPRADLPASDKLTLAPRKGRVVDQKVKPYRGLVYRDRRQLFSALFGTNGFANVDVGQPRHQHNVAGGSLGNL